MSALRNAALAAALALALAGCSTWNPLIAMGVMKESANKPVPLPAFTATVTPKAVWSVAVGKSLGSRFRPAVDDHRVYAASGEGTITIIEEESGRVVSRVDTKKRLSGGLEAGDGKVIAGTVKGEVIALDLSGKLMWTATVAGEVIAPASVSRKVVVVRTSDGRIFGFAADDGKRKWVFQRATPALLLRSSAGVLAVGQDVVAGYPNGKILALDIEDGKLTWEATVTLSRGATELERIADVAGLPVIDGQNVCAGAYQGKVACFEIPTRNMIWSRDLSTSQGLARDAKNIYIIDDASAVHALDKAAGASVWKQDKLLYRRLTAPAVVDGRIVVGDLQGFLHVLDPENGTLVGRLATDGSAVESLVAVPGGVIVQTANGTVALVRL
jgi:outer membrane protein assembly factor BamB